MKRIWFIIKILFSSFKHSRALLKEERLDKGVEAVKHNYQVLQDAQKEMQNRINKAKSIKELEEIEKEFFYVMPENVFQISNKIKNK